MPYIGEEYRELLKGELNDLLKVLYAIPNNTLEGVVNYVITRVIDSLYHTASYKDYNTAVGILECVKQEFYRRRISLYEDRKSKENGDVYNGY